MIGEEVLDGGVPPEPVSPSSSSSSSSSSSASPSGPPADDVEAAEPEVAEPEVAEPDPTASERMERIIQALGSEDGGRKERVYLGTFSRVLPETRDMQGLRDVADLSRQELADCIRDSWNNPVNVGAGRPRQVEPDEAEIQEVIDKMVVVREAHASGDVHCHVALKLCKSLRFRPAKAALLQRHHLASHWSCTHTQFWSVVRYVHIPSEAKPDVDQAPFVWTREGALLDLFAESQEPFMARAWKRRREDKDKAAEAGAAKHKPFSKIDLTSIILDKGLLTKAAIMRYAQDHGTAAMQVYVHQQQRRLTEHLQDAMEWAAAREVAATERESDWQLLCRTADGDCAHGDGCGYAAAAQEAFRSNQSVMSQEGLACALRGVIMNGPSKTTPTPLIVGGTNTGKTTLVLPFDQLFGFSRVLHKPALGSKFALRNILKDKRFLLWDDFRPVEYAAETIPTATQLSLFTGLPFEVQVSQSFNDGNIDFEWRHGAVVTAKEEGLWTPRRNVTEEDIRHLQSRFLVFRCTAQVRQLRDVVPCPIHLARWVRDFAAAHDSRSVVQPLLPIARASAVGLSGMEVLAHEAQIPEPVAAALQAQLLELGAVDARELPAAEWATLPAWSLLKPLEQRRVLRWLQCV